MDIRGIRLENVSRVYSTEPGMKIRALVDVTLAVHPGEFVGIAGKNASGKTTLARLLNGLLLPSYGCVLIDGMDTRDRRKLPDIRRRVAMVFQNPDNQIISPVVEEEIAFGPENLNLPMDEIRHRVDVCLILMGLESLRGQATHLLSGGQKQRLAVAAALAMQPDYLVLDEPTAMLDPCCRRDLIRHLHFLNRERGMTVILASHCMEDLAGADRLLVLKDGSVIADGPPWEVFQREEAGTELDTPDAVRMRRVLRRMGLGLDERISTGEAMVDGLCRLSNFAA